MSFSTNSSVNDREDKFATYKIFKFYSEIGKNNKTKLVNQRQIKNYNLNFANAS